MDNNYQLIRIQNYIQGLLSKEEMYALEREALDDDFLRDALEGYEAQKGVQVKDLSILQKQLAGRIQKSKHARNAHYFGWQRLAIGAAAAVLFVVICSFLLIRYWMPKTDRSNQVEVHITDLEHRISVDRNLSYGDAMPVGGWKAFDEFVNQQIKLSLDKDNSVHITFEVSPDGVPVRIQVPNATNLQKRQISTLLAEGPRWQGQKAELILTLSE